MKTERKYEEFGLKTLNEDPYLKTECPHCKNTNAQIFDLAVSSDVNWGHNDEPVQCAKCEIEYLVPYTIKAEVGTPKHK